MKNMQIFSVEEVGQKVVITLVGGPDNACGHVTFYVPDNLRRMQLMMQADSLYNRGADVSLALNLVSKNWRLQEDGKTVLGGVEKSVVAMSKSEIA